MSPNDVVEALTAPPDQLRETLLKMKGRVQIRPLSAGLLLSRIKRERLWKPWGFRNWSRYCREELEIIPDRFEIIMVAAAERLLHAFKLSPREVAGIDHTGLTFDKIVKISKAAKDREDLEYLLKTAKNAYALRHELRLRQDRIRSRIISFKLNGPDYVVARDILRWIERTYQIGHKKSFMVPILAFKVLVEDQDGKRRWKKLKDELRRHYIPEEISDTLFGGSLK